MTELNSADQNICNDMVTKIAKLARLRLTAQEAADYQENFTELIKLFHELDDLDITLSSTTNRLLTNAQDCRSDSPEQMDMSQLSKASPHFNSETKYFDVPQFIEYNDE